MDNQLPLTPEEENLSLEARYSSVYRKQGIRYFVKMENPKIFRIQDLDEIDLSILHYFYPDHRDSFGISNQSPFVKGRKKGQLSFHHLDYDKGTLGPTRRRIFNSRLAIKAYHKANPGVFWAKKEERFKSYNGRRPWNMIVDYSLMGRTQEFRPSFKRHLYFFEGRYRGYLNGIRHYTKITDRRQLVLFHIPEVLPRVPELKRATIELKRAYWKIFDSYEKLALLDFWKWLDPYTRDGSIFAEYIQEKDLDRMDLLCLYGNSVVLLNLGMLDRWVTGKESLGDDNDVDDDHDPEDDEPLIAQTTARRFQKRFLRFLSKIIEHDKTMNTALVQPLEVDNKQAKEIQVIYDTNTEESLKDEVFLDPDQVKDNGDEIVISKQELENSVDVKEENDSLNEPTQTTTQETVKEVASYSQQPKPENLSQFTARKENSFLKPTSVKSTLADTPSDPGVGIVSGGSSPLTRTNYQPVRVDELITQPIIPNNKPGVQTQVKVSQIIDTKAERQIKDFAVELMLTKRQQEYWEEASETYKRLPSPDKDKTLDEYINQEIDATISEEDTKAPDMPLVTDKSMLKSTLKDFDSRYIEKHLKRDIVRNVVSLQKSGILINKYDVEDQSNLASNIEVHTVQVTPVGGSPSTIRIRLPKVDKDGVMRLNGVRSFCRKMRRDKPIRKIDRDRVSLTSYYGKLFIKRSDKRKYNYTSYILAECDRLIIEGKIKEVQYGQVRTGYEDLPAIIQSMMTRFRGFYHRERAYHIDFTQIAKEKKSHGAKYTFGKHVAYQPDTDTWYLKGREADVEYLFGINTFLAPDEYAEVKILGELIPVGFILARELGFSQLVEMLRLPVTKYEAGKHIERNPKDLVLRFADEKWVFDKSLLSPRDKLIINGMNYYAKYLKQYSVYDFESKDIYGAILQAEGIAVRYERELDLIQDMFIDDSTREVLAYLKEPTEMIPLYIRAIELLSSSHHVDEINMDDMMISGYERVSGAVYKTLINHLRLFKSKPITTKRRFDIPPDDALIMISSDPSTELVDDINPFQNMKEKSNVTFTGEGGRSKRSMVRRTRSYHDSDLGVISAATVDSSDVGITTFLSSNPKFDTVYGTVKESGFESHLDPSNILDTTVLSCPFSDMDDKKRAGFSSIQSSHRIPIKGAMPPVVRTGFESVMAHQVDDKFAYVSKGPGVIKEKTNKYVVISYDNPDLKDDMLELGITIATSKGAHFRHDVVCDREVGYRFEKGEVLVFNQAFFIRDILSPKQVILCDKTYARTMLVESNDTFEDSSAISGDLSKQLTSSAVKERTIVVKNTDTLLNLVNLFDEVDIDTPLVYIEDMAFKDTGYFNSSSIDILKRLSQISPKARYKGRVIKMECFYFCDEEELSPSIQDVVNKIMKYRFSGTKLKLADKRHMTGKIDKPLRFGGADIGPGMVGIRVYIETPLGTASGDKIVVR